MSAIITQAENISKQYRLGEVGTGTLSHDLKRWWYRTRGKEDPFLKVGEVNDRLKLSTSNYSWALKDVNFDIFQGDVVGIIGKNGAGKSTLLKILSQVTTPTTGTLKVKGRIAALLEVGTGFHPDLTGMENIYLNGAILGMRKSEIKAQLDEIIEFSGCARYINTPVKRYSSGMLVRLGFAVAAHLDPEILIVDEVLAVGDVEFQQKCLGKMNQVSQSGRTVLFVSHNMQAITQLCKRGILLENGTVAYDGDVSEAVRQYLSKNVAISSASIDFTSSENRKKGNGIIQISKIEIYNDEELSNQFVIGDDMTVRLYLNAKEATRDVKIAFHFYRYDDSIIANVENIDSDFIFEPFNGEKCFELKFTNINFYPDIYRVGISIATSNWSDYYDQIIPCFEFVIVEGSSKVKRQLNTNGGFIYLTPTWRVR